MGIPTERIVTDIESEFIYKDGDEFAAFDLITLTIKRDTGDDYPEQRSVSLTDAQARRLYDWLGRALSRRSGSQP